MAQGYKFTLCPGRLTTWPYASQHSAIAAEAQHSISWQGNQMAFRDLCVTALCTCCKGITHTYTLLSFPIVSVLVASRHVCLHSHNVPHLHGTCLGLVRTIHIHRIRPYTWWSPCRNTVYALYIIYSGQSYSCPSKHSQLVEWRAMSDFLEGFDVDNCM